MSLREKKKIETKKKIFEVSGRLFKEKGIENTTIDEIVKEAGIDGARREDVKSTIDAKKASEIISAVYFHSLVEWLWSHIDYSFSDDISEKIDLVFEGIAGGRT